MSESVSEELDPRDYYNQDEKTLHVKNILSSLLLLANFNFAKEKDRELDRYDEDFLRALGRNYYLNPPLLHGRLYVKERFWAQALLEKANTPETLHAKLKNLKNIGILLEGMQEGRDEFQATNLPENVFNNKEELELLRDHLAFFFSGPKHTSGAITVFDKLAEHAQRHLHSTQNSKRAQRGQEKYQQLVQLFQNIRNYDELDAIPRLNKIVALIKAELDADPKEDNLIANRGGFFGAYKTYSQCLNRLGFLHYEYNGRTAISKTDHLLIEMLDTIENELKNLGYDPSKEDRVQVLD